MLTTHPIQYQVPVWKQLAARGNVPFKVFYMSDQGLESRFDPGFGKVLSWDIDLLGGYESEFLETYQGRQLDSFWWLRLRRGFGRQLRQANAEVLWIQGWQVAAYWQAMFEARRAGIDVWLRGDTTTRSSAGGSGQGLKRRLRRELLLRVDRLLYVGEANRQFYLQQGIAEERLAPAPHCVDNMRFAAMAASSRRERDRIREEWQIPAEAFCFLFVGKMIANKRPLDLVQATRLLQNTGRAKKIHLLWVGTGELDAELRQVCNVCFDLDKGADLSNVHYRPNASFVGFLNQSEISRAYVAADCLVLPSARETWGLVVNEAMASGLPCVVNDACGCAEDLVKPIRPDLCYPVRDISALAHAMAAAITCTPPSQILTEHISKYDVSRTVDTVEKLYFDAKTGAAPKSDRVADQ